MKLNKSNFFFFFVSLFQFFFFFCRGKKTTTTTTTTTTKEGKKATVLLFSLKSHYDDGEGGREGERPRTLFRLRWSLLPSWWSKSKKCNDEVGGCTFLMGVASFTHDVQRVSGRFQLLKGFTSNALRANNKKSCNDVFSYTYIYIYIYTHTCACFSILSYLLFVFFFYLLS